jgi:hypothetical protein
MRMTDNAGMPLLHRLTARALSLTALSVALLPTVALAQSAAASPPPDPALLTEVVVTAQRRDEARWRVAASLSRLEPGITGVIDRTHAAEALNRIPGVLMQRGSGQESLLAIRSPVLTGAGACGAFLLLEDGMPLRPTGFCNVNQLFEANTSQAAAVEVLRGPGTGPYGANAVHGIVNVLSPDPGDLPGLRLGVTRGADEHLALQFAAAGESTAAYGLWRDEDGFRAESPVREWKANAVHQRRLGTGELRLRAAATQLDQETAGFIRGFDAYRDPVLRESNPNPEAFRDADSARVSGEWLSEPCDGCRDEVRGIVRHSGMAFLQHFLLARSARAPSSGGSASMRSTPTLPCLRSRTAPRSRAVRSRVRSDPPDGTTTTRSRSPVQRCTAASRAPARPRSSGGCQRGSMRPATATTTACATATPPRTGRPAFLAPASTAAPPTGAIASRTSRRASNCDTASASARWCT